MIKTSSASIRPRKLKASMTENEVNNRTEVKHVVSFFFFFKSMQLPATNSFPQIKQSIFKFTNIYGGKFVEKGQICPYTWVKSRERAFRNRPINSDKTYLYKKQTPVFEDPSYFVSVWEFHIPETSSEGPHFESLWHSEQRNNSP
jgi:hypothetical protein